MEANDIPLAFHAPCENPNFIPHDPPIKCNCRNQPFEPVCSLSGATYENNCALNCTQQIMQNAGPCSAQCDCPKKYQPTCGVDGLTYDNKCTLNCVKVLRQGNGECPSILKGCEYCSKVFMPVCGGDNITYRNLCELKCNGGRFLSFGKCKDILVKRTDCGVCGDASFPICGSDGRNYKNECECTCQGSCRKYSEGECPVEQSCARCRGVIQPICGQDGLMYDNICFMECANVRRSPSHMCNMGGGVQVFDQDIPMHPAFMPEKNPAYDINSAIMGSAPLEMMFRS